MKNKTKNLNSNTNCCFYYLLVLRIQDVYPGSRIRIFSIPDPGSEFFPSESRIRIEEFKKMFPSSPNIIRVFHLGSKSCFFSSRILDPNPQHCYLLLCNAPNWYSPPLVYMGLYFIIFLLFCVCLNTKDARRIQ